MTKKTVTFRADEDTVKAIENIKKEKGFEHTSTALKFAIGTAASNPEEFKKFLESKGVLGKQ